MNCSTSRLGVVVALVAVAAAGLSACTSSDSSSAPSTSASMSGSSASSTTAVAATTGCTKAGLTDAATTAVKAISKDNTYAIDDVKCADGWAVTSGLLASTANPNMGAPTTLVFQQQGQLWVGQDKQNVCGTNASTTPAPADATIPASLYELGCLTG